MNKVFQLRSLLTDFEQGKPVADELRRLGSSRLTELRTQLEEQIRQAREHGDVPSELKTLEGLRGLLVNMIHGTLETMLMDTMVDMQQERLALLKQSGQSPEVPASAPAETERRTTDVSAFDPQPQTRTPAPTPAASGPKDPVRPTFEEFRAQTDPQGTSSTPVLIGKWLLARAPQFLSDTGSAITTFLADAGTTIGGFFSGLWNRFFGKKAESPAGRPYDEGATQQPETPPVLPQPETTPAPPPAQPAGTEQAAPAEDQAQPPAGGQELSSGQEVAFEGHRFAFSTDDQHLLSLDGQRYAGSFLFWSVNGTYLHSQADSIKLMPDHSLKVSLRDGDVWTLSESQLSAMLQTIVAAQSALQKSFLLTINYTDSKGRQGTRPVTLTQL